VHVYVQRLVSVVKMVTVLEGVLLKSSVVRLFFFLLAKGLDAKVLLFSVGSVCHIK
jgi:hypothetical protein